MTGSQKKGELSKAAHFFFTGFQFNSCFPPSLKQSLALRGENILFHFSHSVVKGLGTLVLSSSRHSLTLLLPPPLSPLFLTSGPVKPLAGGEMEGVRLLDAGAHTCVFLCVFAPRAGVVCIRGLCARASASDSVCALFKPTVSKALQGSLCIIGDLLLSAHCI